MQLVWFLFIGRWRIELKFIGQSYMRLSHRKMGHIKGPLVKKHLKDNKN